MPLSIRWRRALEIVADASADGITNTELMAQGFSAEMIAGLVLSGHVAMAGVETAGDQPIKVVRIRITPAGRKAIADSTQ
jgi:hypothetical protein